MNYLVMEPHSENVIRLLKPLKKDSFEFHYQFFVPVIYTIWHVEYKNVFRKTIHSQVIIGEDFIKKRFGFADEIPVSISAELEDQEILILPPSNLEKQLDNAYEFIRKFYIHQKRSWSIPKITLHKKEIIFLPYSIFLKNTSIGEKKDLLFEHYSMNLDLLSNHGRMRELLLSKREEG